MNAQQKLTSSNLFVGINEPSDPHNLSDLEKRHIPVVEVPDRIECDKCLEVRVEVGKLKVHPNAHDHFIQFVDLYADDTFLARADLRSVTTFPKVAFCILLKNPAAELRAYGHCNKHGTWVGRKPLNVVD